MIFHTGKSNIQMIAFKTRFNVSKILCSDQNDPEILQMSSLSCEETSSRGKLIHMQLLPTNVKRIVVGDVDGDGLNEVIMCHTDRVVSACRYLQRCN